ncbi:MAG: hypothetical protein ABI947_22640 [Chloroflexota bacterium]
MYEVTKVESTLQRLLTVNWKADYARYKSHKALLHEYFRRTALWAKALVATAEWPIIDLALHIDPSIRAEKAILDRWRQHLDHTENDKRVPPEMEFILEAALHWASVEDKQLTGTFNLPQPYEPIILMYERGGFFYRSHEGIDITAVTAISRRGWDAYDRDTPWGSIEVSELDKIDSRVS